MKTTIQKNNAHFAKGYRKLRKKDNVKGTHKKAQNYKAQMKALVSQQPLVRSLMSIMKK